MHGSIDFENQAQLGAVEIDDEPPNGVLPAKLEAEHSAVAEQPPRRSLGRGGAAPQRARALERRCGDGVASAFHADHRTAGTEVRQDESLR